MALYHSVTDLIGNTPLLTLSRYGKQAGTNATLLAKLEGFNPGGSAKDRIALSMILEAEKTGKLLPGGTIVEPTSGNTGIGLATVGTARGYSVIFTMPDTMSRERQGLLRALGAQVVLTEGKLGMEGAIAEAKRIADTTGAFLPSQFDNPANPTAHYETTGPEIWQDTRGKVDILVAGVGTGGTLCGTAKYLKEQNPSLVAIAVEPIDSPVLSGGEKGAHGLQGIGAGFIPGNYDATLVDEILTVSLPDALNACHAFATAEGLLCGISSGAALHAATLVAKRPENASKTIVAILPDSGERYLSVPGYLAD